MTRNTIAAGFFTFFVLGTAAGSYGPAINPLREDFGLSAGAAGSLLTVHSISALLGVAVFAVAGRWLTFRIRLVAATVLFMVGAALFGLGGTWSLTLVATAVMGLGFGISGNAYNTRFAVAFGTKSVVMLALLNVLYGAGSFCGPFIVGLVGASNFRSVYVGAAIVATLPLILLLITHEGTDARVTTRVHHDLAPRNKSVIVVFGVMLFLQTGIEASSGAWINTHLTDAGVAESTASFVTGSFWAALATGRLLMIWFTRHFSEPQIIFTSITLLIPVVCVTFFGTIGVFTYAVLGLLIAPLFPCAMTWAARKTGYADHVGTVLYATALVGGGLMPVVVGRIIDFSDPSSVPLVFAVMAAIYLVVGLPMAREKQGSSHPQPSEVLRHTEVGGVGGD
jgi:FHS family glucose/mannose:H+ symporter-like MFS transporter